MLKRIHNIIMWVFRKLGINAYYVRYIKSDQRDVIRRILEHVGLWEECHARPAGVLLDLIKPAKMQFNSSLIESWGSNTEQTQAQNGSEPKEN